MEQCYKFIATQYTHQPMKLEKSGNLNPFPGGLGGRPRGRGLC